MGMKKPTKKTIAEVSEETLKIQRLLEEQPDGKELSFDYISAKTGVTMDDRGKGFLRTAMKRAKKVYSPIRGQGVKLADSKSTMPILINKMGKIDRAVKRSEKTHKTLQEQFFSSLPLQQQKEILYIGAVFGAIRVAAENGKIVYSRKKEISDTINIPLPPHV